MIIDWFHLLLAVCLLFFPRQWLRFGQRIGSSRRRARLFDTNPAKVREPGDPSVSFRIEFGKLRNYIDLFRAGLGSTLLFGTFAGMDPAWRAASDPTPEMVRAVVYGRLLVVLVGVLIQTFRFEHRISLFPPIFFLSGLTVGMCGLYPALFAFALAWAINLALPNPTSFLSVHALLILTFGLLFDGLSGPMPFATAGLLFLPVLISLLSRRRLALFSKRMKSPGAAVVT